MLVLYGAFFLTVSGHFPPTLNVSGEPGFDFILFFVVVGLELRAYTLSHSTSPFL
jgi:hypothetical protein